MDRGPAVSLPFGGESPAAAFVSQTYHRSNPLRAIRQRARGAQVTFARSNYIDEAVQAALGADVAIVFATEWRTEGLDSPDLSLPNGQDALIAAVAEANPNTIVVLESGGPVLMPWLSKTAAVLEAWYPGGHGAQAIAAVLFGDVNPSGRLPVSFPLSVADLPRPRLDGWAPGADSLNPAAPQSEGDLRVNYDIEGSDIGYRWYAREGKKAAFPFGYGLSYTSFTRSAFTTDGKVARVTVANTGAREGADVVQVYLVSAAGKPRRRLVAFGKVALQPGESRTVSLPIEPRVLADWAGDGWLIRSGDYRFAVGSDAESLLGECVVRLKQRRWKD
jgi:beta-glucosidase